MGMNSFAPYSKNPNTFLVQNIGTNPKKTIFIFNYPIKYGGVRDLLAIEGIAESDLRASLLKGELQHKIKTNEIVVLASDIDLLQFNLTQKAFLQGAGVVNGLEVSGSGSGITESDHQTIRNLIHFVDNGPADGFATGAYRETTPIGNPFPTAITWYIDATKTKKIVEKLITYNVSQFPIIIAWNLYGPTGISIVHSVIDTISYSGAIETSRTRAIV